MNAFLTWPGRRFLPLLAFGGLFAGFLSPAHAGMLNSSFTDRATIVLSNRSASGLTARIVYASQAVRTNTYRNQAHSRTLRADAAALALTLIIPAGTTPVIPDSPSPPPPPPPPPPSPPPSSPPPSPPPTPPGGGHIASSPEPGALLLALTGSGTALLAWIRRRRQT